VLLAGSEIEEARGGFGSSGSPIPNFGIVCPVSRRQIYRKSCQLKAQNASIRTSISIPSLQEQRVLPTMQARKKQSIEKTKATMLKSTKKNIPEYT
jgi:hypothetical protein